MVNAQRGTGVSRYRKGNHFAVIAKRDMPAYKMGKLWKFKLSEVDEWIKAGGADDRKKEE